MDNQNVIIKELKEDISLLKKENHHNYELKNQFMELCDQYEASNKKLNKEIENLKEQNLELHGHIKLY